MELITESNLFLQLQILDSLVTQTHHLISTSRRAEKETAKKISRFASTYSQNQN